MSVDTTSRKVTYTCSAVAAYDFTFRALTSAPTDIKVKLKVVATGVETDMTYTTAYTAAINSNGVGGTVTLVTTYGTTHQITIYRETTDKQESDYSDYNQFPADTLETDIDRRTMKSQEVVEDVGRSAKVSVTSTISSLTLPDPSEGKTFVWSRATLINSTYAADSMGTAALSYATNALSSQVAAAASAAAALLSQYSAGTSATSVIAAATASVNAIVAATAATLAAQTAQYAAGTYATNAVAAATSATASVVAATAATVASQAAQTAAVAAATSATSSVAASTAATVAAQAAQTGAVAAATSATASVVASTTATLAAQNAQYAAQTASTSAIAAATSATNTAAGIKQHIRCTLPAPNDYYTNISRALCLVSRLDAAITITNILCTGEIDPTTETIAAMYYADSFIGTANAIYISSTTTIAGAYTSGTISVTVPTTMCIYVEFKGTAPDAALKQLHWDATFTY